MLGVAQNISLVRIAMLSGRMGLGFQGFGVYGLG